MVERKPSSRREILTLLKQHGRMTVEELSRSLGITPMGVRQHLATLERDGLVESSQLRRKVGRPSFLYHLTPKAEDEFPHRYDDLAIRLLRDIRELEGEEGLSALMARQEEYQAKRWGRRVQGESLETRLNELCDALREEGQMPSLRRLGDGSWEVRIANCLRPRAARAFPVLCDADAGAFQRILGVQVQRDTCMATGDGTCVYRVTAVPDQVEQAAGE